MNRPLFIEIIIRHELKIDTFIHALIQYYSTQNFNKTLISGIWAYMLNEELLSTPKQIFFTQFNVFEISYNI